MSANNNGRHEKRNTMLFWIAAGVSFSLIVWFTLAFFRNVWDMHDVSLGIMSIGLGIIASYAGHNSFMKTRCVENGRNTNRPGEWIFALIIFWAILMWTTYQTKAFSHWKAMELVVPEQFYEFLVTIVAIFGGTRVWDIFSSTGRGKNHSADATNKDSVKNNAPAP